MYAFLPVHLNENHFEDTMKTNENDKSTKFIRKLKNENMFYAFETELAESRFNIPLYLCAKDIRI